ncbi:MAG: UDP-3-O-acyl-N-acetylglucosamine deacetylase [candidate division WOR-3 bacterium]
MPRKTLKNEIRLEGIGVHTGAKASVIIGPSGPGQGIVFLSEGVRIPASLDFVSSSDRRTDLSAQGRTVMTTEHILSALLGMGVDDATISVYGPEIPFFDGSALAIAEAIAETGLTDGPGEPEVVAISEEVVLRVGETEFRVYPADSLEIACRIKYDHPFIPEQEARFKMDPETYLREIAPARTYIFYEEAEEILSRGLGKGGSLDCVLVIKKDGYMNQPRFPDEPVRHKIADMIGDLALLGARLRMGLEAERPGHGTNHALARFIREKGG